VSGGDRSKADLTLLEALVAGRTTAQAADDAGVSVATVRRRLNDPTFQGRLAQARAARYERVLDRTTEYVNAAVSQLGRYLLDDATNPHLGMSAAMFHARRLEAIRLLVQLYFGGRVAARDEEMRVLRGMVEGLESEVRTFRELYGLQEGGVDGERWAAPAG
jgi:DNA-binding LacI/PurR family transcriptional regulator